MTLRMSRWLGVWLGVTLFWASASQGKDRRWSEGELLPTPRGLEQDVRFWEKVFAKYRTDQCVFHDKDDLNIVYAVKTIPGRRPSTQAKNMRRYLGAIRASLKHLADGGRPRNLLERRVVEVTPKSRRGSAHYRQAAANVRCQRGVDLRASFARSQHHMTMVKRILREAGLPADLAYLPHLESGFHVRAHSRSGARGLWQLMPATARLQGLRVTKRMDQRIDPKRSTMAAARFLRSLYDRTQSWPLAITAYNYGPNGIRRAIQRWGRDYMTVRDNHRTRIFGFAAKNYYPSFLAVRNLALQKELGLRTSDPVALETRRRERGRF